MSNFPFNNDRYEYKDFVNGCPLNLGEFVKFSNEILFWHTNKNISDFSQSNDGFDSNVKFLTFGLIELLSDPNMIHRLITTGKQVEKDCKLIFESENNWENIKSMLDKFFHS